MAACPSSPDNISTVEELEGKKVEQVIIGSCTNSSLRDLMLVAAVLKGKTVNPDVTLSIAPGSRQVLEMLAENGAILLQQEQEYLNQAAELVSVRDKALQMTVFPLEHSTEILQEEPELKETVFIW
jgi:homoaconitase/3-isopropylmalate dehydratase large subunit